MSDRAILLGMIEEESDPERKSVLERLLRRMDEREKTGTWKPANIRDKSMMFICSECGKIAYYPQGNRKKQEKPKTCKYEVCPNCGKPMQIY